MKLEVLVKEYLIEIEVRKYTPKTIRGYRNGLNLFLRFCKENLKLEEIEDVTLTAVRQFSKYLTGAGRKGTYVNGLLKTIKSFLQYCYEEGYGGFNTKKNFKWCKEERPVIMAYRPSDVRQMLQSCRGYDFISVRDNAVLTALFETGIRCWELCCVQKDDIHDDFIVIKGKNHKQRVVPITPILQKALLRYENVANQYFTLKSTDDYYFLSFHGKQLTNSAVEHKIDAHLLGQGGGDLSRLRPAVRAAGRLVGPYPEGEQGQQQGQSQGHGQQPLALFAGVHGDDCSFLSRVSAAWSLGCCHLSSVL